MPATVETAAIERFLERHYDALAIILLGELGETERGLGPWWELEATSEGVRSTLAWFESRDARSPEARRPGRLIAPIELALLDRGPFACGCLEVVA